MARVFAKVDADLDGHPKVLDAGREGREVFELMLRTNWLNSHDGTIPPRYCTPRFVARKLGYHESPFVADPIAVAEHGIRRAVEAELLTENGDGSMSIVGWDDEWRGPKSVKRRKRR